MARLLDGFYRWLLFFAAIFTFLAFVSIVLGVASRHIGFEVAGLDAYAGYSIAAALFLALPGTLRHGEHIRVTLFLNRATGTTRKILDYWCLLAGSGIALYLAWYAVRLVWLSHITEDVSPGTDRTPLWIPQLTMAIGCIGFAIALLEDLYRKITGNEREQADSSEAAHIE